MLVFEFYYANSKLFATLRVGINNPANQEFVRTGTGRDATELRSRVSLFIDSPPVFMNDSANLPLFYSRDFFALSEFLYLLYQIEPGASFDDHILACFKKALPELKISGEETSSSEFFWIDKASETSNKRGSELRDPSMDEIKPEAFDRFPASFLGNRDEVKEGQILRKSTFEICPESQPTRGEANEKVFNALAPHIRNAFQIATRIALAQNQTKILAQFDLTPREKEVALWMKEGKRDKEIAIILGISSRTVEKHVHQILDKLQVENRSSAIAVLTEARPSWKVQPSNY